jgi:hypothetical protein
MAQAGAQAGAQAPAALASEERTRIEAAAERGRLLFDFIRAAQLTTRDMLQRVPDPEGAGIAGWIAERANGGLLVTYYALGSDGPVAVYRGTVSGGGALTAHEVFAGGERPALDAAQRRLAAAREAVTAVERTPCGGAPSFNVFVIPPESADAPIDVYTLSPQTQRSRFPLGGHFLSRVAADGTVSEVAGFAPRCMDVEAPPAAAGAQPAPVRVLHPGTLPTELHALLSLWMNRPLLVATGNPVRIWGVTQGRIGLVPETAPAIIGR